MSIVDIYLWIGSLTVLFFLSRNTLKIILGLTNYNIHKKRLKQLNFKKENNLEVQDLIDLTTKPFLNTIKNKSNVSFLNKIDRNLKLIEWDDFLNAEKFIAVWIITKVVAIIIFFLLKPLSMFFATIWFVVLFFSIDIFYRNGISTKKERYLIEFPHLIRTVSSYLGSGLTIEEAFMETIKGMDTIWRESIKDLILDIDAYNLKTALNNFKNKVPIKEAREFAILINLSLESSKNIKESFDAQIERIEQLLELSLEMKIQKRETMGYIVQMPLLLGVMVAFGLPIAYSMVNLTSL